jgi:hypothetical protein
MDLLPSRPYFAATNGHARGMRHAPDFFLCITTAEGAHSPKAVFLLPIPMTEQTYYIVIPGIVYGDKALDSLSKLLYGEIAAKCNRKGYCWATNETLAELMQCSVRTLQRALKALEGRRHVKIEVMRDEAGTQRRIWLREGFDSENMPEDRGMTKKEGVPKSATPHAKSDNFGGDTGVTQNTLTNTDYSKGNNLNSSPARASEHEGIRWPWETETFWEAWVQWREYKLKEHRFRYKLASSEQAALNELQRLSGDSEATAHAIMQQARANGWKGFYALKNVENESNRRTSAGGNGKTGTSDARIDALRRW